MTEVKISEENLEFVFTDWEKVLKFDTHTDYTKVKNILPPTNGVDFLGVKLEKVIFIEVKDFRDHRIENKKRLSDAELMIEVGQKVKGTLACILAGTRNSTNDSEFWKKIAAIIQDLSKEVFVILWLEEDNSIVMDKSYQGRLGTYTNVLKQKLSWFSKRVIILNRNVPNSIGVKVSPIN